MNPEEEVKKNRIILFLGSSMLRNIVYTIGAVVLFISGVIVYGIILKLREVPLQEAIAQKGFRTLNDVNLLVDRKTFSLILYEDTVFIKSYRVSFGRNLNDKKKLVDDEATPVGIYKICSITDDETYYKFLRINYPNLEDAAEALRKSLITQKQFNQIKFEFYYEECVESSPVLGGNIGIHGIGRLNSIFKNLPFVYNWTDGSIAMSNEDLDEILTVINTGTNIVIK